MASVATYAMSEHLRVVVLLAPRCQLRHGEILGLRRRGVDLLHRALTVRTAWTRAMNGQILEKAQDRRWTANSGNTAEGHSRATGAG